MTKIKQWPVQRLTAIRTKYKSCVRKQQIRQSKIMEHLENVMFYQDFS